MIQTYSTTIRRKEMDAVLTCMVDEKIGPGELNIRLIQQVKETFKCDGAVALRSPAIALNYVLKALDLEKGSKILLSALAPSWQYQVVEGLGYEPYVLDVEEATGLVNAKTYEEATKNGGKLIILHETEGIVPSDLNEILQIGIPVREDISQSAGAVVNLKNETTGEVEQKRAGLFGLYTILGLEERDVITAGGGAVLMAPGRREWIVLKKFVDEAPVTDLLPDINCALGWVQVKEYARNEKTRKEFFAMYQQACMMGRHKMFAREGDDGSTMSCFPLILNTSFKDVKQYTARKEIEIQPAFENSIIAYKDELSSDCVHAKSIMLRCAHFPLYPRLTHNEVAKIVKVLGSLP